MTDRYVCIHGHFYQPPRENPWLETIELQDSAYPYHDWNERITTECYAPNAASRILDGQNRIISIINNYARMSFDFGPTLLSWMEKNAPDVYQAILEADRESQNTFSGHGSAMAQAYSHMIMPLASRRDKYTQVVWGIRDFKHRFGRSPEGMWLPETAVDLETLDMLAQLDIRFTILAPHQARRVRPTGSGAWEEVSDGKIDPSMAYNIRLPSEKSISLFFYNGPISRAVAFEGLLTSGEAFAHRVLGALSEGRHRPQLLHIATDGETYGHHHRHGEMALARAVHLFEADHPARLTNYGQFLEAHPPTHEVEIYENTSWSCAHGIERWRSDCGCNSGGNPGWSQGWRAPLREALDWLRDTLAPGYDHRGGQLFKDPWGARDDYVSVVLDRSGENVERFLAEHALRKLNEQEKVTALKLLELQRHAMLMYTSCGWFFDDLSGIETVQLIQYAGRAVQLAKDVLDDGVEPRFLDLLEAAKSNKGQHGDGRRIYEASVKPAMVDLETVAAHYAISSLFEEYEERTAINCYLMDREDSRTLEAGRTRLTIGRVRVSSQVTCESAVVTFGVMHLGGHNISAGVKLYQGEETYEVMVRELSEAFERADFPGVIRLMDRHFGESTYSLRSIFRDEQRKVVGQVLESTLASVESDFRHVYEDNYPLMRFLTGLGNPLPRALRSAAEFVINADLRKRLGEDLVDVERIGNLLEDSRIWDIVLDKEELGYLFGTRLGELISRLKSDPEDLPVLKCLAKLATLVVVERPFAVDLWRVQNLYYEMLRNIYPSFHERAQHGDQEAGEWVSYFTSLGERLSVGVP